MEQRFRVLAGANRQMKRALLLVAILAGTASAAPKKKAAKKEFDKGVAAYTNGDFIGAAEAFSRSNAIEADVETLFAWAQSERKLDRCDKALELYTKLLAMDMPAENKEAIKVQAGECKDILGQPGQPVSGKTDKVEKTEKAPDPTPPNTTTTTPDTTSGPGESQQPPPSSPTTPEGRTWWKDPVGGALVGAGVVGVGLGVVFLVQGSAAESDKETAMNYDDYVALDERAKSRGQLGVISLVAGGALAAGGVAWYVTHKQSHGTTVTGWLDGQSGGFVVRGGF
jgi:tetratricopeptide (TPR) repeat protein